MLSDISFDESMGFFDESTRSVSLLLVESNVELGPSGIKST